MNTVEIQKILEKELGSVKFLGVYASDKLPKYIISKPSCLVVNTHNSSEPGEHWVSIYLDHDENIDFFDSYGNNPEKYPQFESFLNKNGKKSINWNDNIIQGKSSVTCGNYSVFFCIHRSKGIPMHRIANFFSADRSLNDCYIVRWVKKYFLLPTMCHFYGVQSCINFS